MLPKRMQELSKSLVLQYLALEELVCFQFNKVFKFFWQSHCFRFNSFSYISKQSSCGTIIYCRGRRKKVGTIKKILESFKNHFYNKQGGVQSLPGQKVRPAALLKYFPLKWS